MKRRPRGRTDLSEVGLFAESTRWRIDPGAGTVAAALCGQDDTLWVRGLVAIERTPVLDLKPYSPRFEWLDRFRFPGWVNKAMRGYS